ncbi:uncharacterized protein BDZ99DRAFT_483124 [Mytilinidion resinicola]|uniref:Uncharacterized protein n=1 Tax=Mytilinidion resinicola TaxID=574789 RepID=A0A6A6Y007_9PEZI|nr:uncharacterized protein BDZ99DRAFT_483124 [Mytilinidion resinicola]KAF2802102.1 hypothetical protein BDZ99DRAFT_483124 [Mytilinidion resinicola]
MAALKPPHALVPRCTRPPLRKACPVKHKEKTAYRAWKSGTSWGSWQAGAVWLRRMPPTLHLASHLNLARPITTAQRGGSRRRESKHEAFLWTAGTPRPHCEMTSRQLPAVVGSGRPGHPRGLQQTPESHSCSGLTSPESRPPSVHFPTRSHAAHRPSGVDSGPPWCFPGAHQRPPLPKTALNLSAVSNWQHAVLGTSTLASRALCRSSGRSQVPGATRNPH